MKNLHKKGQAYPIYLSIVLIILFGIAIRYGAIAGFSHTPESDELAYKSMAFNLVNGNGIIDGMGNHAMYNVGYPLFILAPVFYFFGADLFAARIANLMLGGVAIFLCFLLAKEAGARNTGSLFAAAIWAIYLPASIYSTYLLKENLMLPLMLGAFLCILRLARAPSTGSASVCGILFGLLILTGNAALALAGPLVIALLVAPASIQKRLALAGMILALAVAVTAPWVVRNWKVIGAPVLNTNGGFNLYLGNNSSATGWFVSIADTPRGNSWDALRQTGEFQASQTLKKEAIAWIKSHPTEFLSLALKKAVYFWTPPFHKGTGQTSMLEAIVRSMWAMQFLIITAAAVGSLCFRNLRNKQITLLFMGICCYTSVHMLFYVTFRYRLPIMPMLTIIAALTLEHVYQKFKEFFHTRK